MKIALGIYSPKHVDKLIAALASIMVFFCFFLIGCGGGGGSTATPGPTPTPVPGPQITSINPSIVGGGFTAFTLTVNGSTFGSNSVVQWNGSSRTTTFVSSTQLTAAITAADVATPGNVTVTVVTTGVPASPAASTTFVVAPFPPPFSPVFSPMNASANGPAFTLDVFGGNFTTASTVLWNGSPRPTTFISIAELHAAISSADLASAGLVSVGVMNPAPGGGTATSASSFIISNPAPLVSSISPAQALRGDPDLTLTVTGQNFVSNSTVRWNGSPRPTTFADTGTLKATISAADFATTGFDNVTVSNSAPGGGVSTASQFTVAVPLTVVSQTANDIVYDPVQKVIYLSVPGTASTNPNTIAIMDPASATISSAALAGLNPNLLAISDDSTLLYASLDGTVNTPLVTPLVRGSVQQFALPALTTGIDYQLADDASGPPSVLDMQVAPGAPRTTAVALGNNGTSPRCQGGIMIFDDATARTNALAGFSTSGNCYDVLRWGADATALFAGNTDTTGDNFYTLIVDANGVTLGHNSPGLLFGGGFSFGSGAGLVYFANANIFSPALGKLLPIHFVQGTGSAINVVDSANNSIYFLLQTPGGPTAFEVLKFDLTTQALLSTMPIISINGVPQRFIRWGTSGLGFVTSTGNVYLLTQ